MNCWHCNTELIWGGDHDIEDEVYSIVSNLSCPKCNAHVEVFLGDDRIVSQTPEEAMKKYTAKLKKDNNKFKKDKNDTSK